MQGGFLALQAGPREVKPMADIEYSTLRDGDPDDLPKTLRRERDARARETLERGQHDEVATGRPAPDVGPLSATLGSSALPAIQATAPVVVTDIRVSGWRLAAFFVKCVLAGIPALILLGAVLFVAGEILQAFFPWLVKMQILVHFPQS